MGRWMDGLMAGCIDGQICGWMNGWMDEWTQRYKKVWKGGNRYLHENPPCYRHASGSLFPRLHGYTPGDKQTFS